MDPLKTSFPPKHFFQHYEPVLASTEALKRDVFRLRHSVYCRELGMAPPTDSPPGLEVDAFDAYAQHCLIRRKDGTPAGCARLIIRAGRSAHLPLQFEAQCLNKLEELPPTIETARAGACCEVSRLAVSPDFRHRGKAGAPGGGSAGLKGRSAPGSAASGEAALVPIGLYLAVASLFLLQELDGMFAKMQPGMLEQLAGLGLELRQLTPLVDYHGRRFLCASDPHTLVRGMAPELRELFDGIYAAAAEQLSSAYESPAFFRP